MSNILQLQLDLNSLFNWILYNLLSFNLCKFVFMSFLCKLDSQYIADGHEINVSVRSRDHFIIIKTHNHMYSMHIIITMHSIHSCAWITTTWLCMHYMNIVQFSASPPLPSSKEWGGYSKCHIITTRLGLQSIFGVGEEHLGSKLWGVLVAASASWEMFIGGITARLGAGGGGTWRRRNRRFLTRTRPLCVLM